jgi:hypothetical protein
MKNTKGKNNSLLAIREAKKQLSFDFDESVMSKIKEISIRDGISPNDVVRRVIGLDVNPPKRPRISLSITQSELEKLSGEMDVNVNDSSKLKRNIKELIENKCNKE